MIHRSKQHLLFPLLALGMSLAIAASAQAQTSASLQIDFGSSPHWSGVRGTRVQEIRSSDRPDYDMFRYGGSYYVYNNNRWYSSRRGRGQFNAIDDRRVPTELSRVPRDHWRTYPTAWLDKDGNPRGQGQKRGWTPQSDNGRGNH